MSTESIPLRIRGRSPLSLLRQSLVRATVGTLALNLTTTLLNFLLTLVLARALGAEQYGAYAFAFGWAMLLGIPSVLGLTPLIIRHVAAYAAQGSWPLVRGLLRRSNQAVLLASFAVAAVAALLESILNGSNDVLFYPFLLALLLVPIFSLTSVRQAAMQGLNRVVLGRFPETVIAPFLLLVMVVFAWAVASGGLSATTAMALNVSAASIAFAIGAVMLRRTLPAEARDAVPEYEARKWIRAGLPLIAFSVLMAFNSQIGTILLAWTHGPADAGVYSVASRVTTFISFLWLAATYPLMPTVARLYADGDVRAVQRILTISARVVLVVSVAVGLALVLFAAPFLSLFGGDFEVGVTPLRILAIGEVSNALSGFAGVALLMSGHEASMTYGIAIGSAVNVALSAALIPLAGVNGAAVGMTCGMIVWNVLLSVFLWRKTRLYAPGIGLRFART